MEVVANMLNKQQRTRDIPSVWKTARVKAKLSQAGAKGAKGLAPTHY
jgi:hypothetical protein